ncbi:LRR domain containing protein [Trema orientale]|uniref:LRR domain containing protein n=1 Tax=Trema orientale TaxID=63057 RepID=A0A2P5CFP7_TREOI|nr:LRR domain containing protein [Trema orientale]
MKKLIINHNPYLTFYLVSCCFVGSHSLVSFRCLSDQSYALLQFKQEFEINESYSSSDASRPKNVVMATWNGSTDCCFWSGVRCDTSSGHVLGLDLSNCGLQGQLSANSSLFSFDQLQQLNLASNNFSYSQIPPRFGQLSRLTHLDLSDSVFSGNIPPELLLLINLESLDLSGNYHIFAGKLEMKSLVQAMPNLRQLHLDWVEFNSSVPESLTNLSSLTSLSLSGCRLRGGFPRNIFQLPNIRAIDVSDNDELTVSLPQYGSGNSLRLLDISFTNFSGELSDSIGYLSSLEVLDLGSCFLSGAVPSWIWKLSQLTYLDLSYNNLDGQLPISLGENLANLTLLELGSNKFSGRIPSSIGNLRRLESLGLS